MENNNHNNPLRMISNMNNPMDIFISMMQRNNPQIANQMRAMMGQITPEQAKKQIAEAISKGQVSKTQMLQVQQLFKSLNLDNEYNNALHELNVNIDDLGDGNEAEAPKEESKKFRF